MKWPVVPLENLAEIVGGSTPRRDRSEFWEGAIPWATPTDLPAPGQGIAEITETARYITDEGLESCSAQLLPVGTVLFSSRATIGKLGIAAIPLTTNQGFANFIPKSYVYNRYLAYCLLYFSDSIIAMAGNTTFKEVTKSSLKRFRVPLPPLSEQRRIVEILDQTEALRKKRSEADAKAEPILPALFYKMFGDPAINPREFHLVPIRTLVSMVNRRNPSEQADMPFSYIDIAGVDGAQGRITEVKNLIGADAPSRARQIVKTNDILVSTVRPYLRATAIVPSYLDNQICSTGFCVLRAKEGKGFGYLYALSRLPWFTYQLNERARGASYPAVTDNDVLDLNVPYPNDTKIILIFDKVVTELAALQEQRLLFKNKIEILFSTILHRAFSGDLTAIWREAYMKEIVTEMEEKSGS